MKRKIFIVLTILISLFTLVSCGSTARKKADVYHNVLLNYTEADLTNAIEAVEDSTVTIAFGDSSFLTSYSYQSGTIYKYDGTYYYVATSFSNTISQAKENKSYIFVASGTRYNVDKIRYDSYNQISCIRFKSSASLKVATIKNDSVDIGTPVFSVFTKKAESSMLSSGAYESGFVNAGIVSRNTGRLLQHTALTSSDALGSGLFDYDGNLVGINTIKDTISDKISKDHDMYGINYAISNEAFDIISNDIEGIFSNVINASVSRCNFNCGYEFRYVLNDCDKQVFNNMPDGFTCGLYINTIASENSFKSSLSRGDYVYEINGKAIESMDVLLNELYLHTKLDVITIKLYRASGNSYVIKTITN